jgi:hypothetical protein
VCWGIGAAAAGVGCIVVEKAVGIYQGEQGRKGAVLLLLMMTLGSDKNGSTRLEGT